MVKVNLYRRH